MNCVSLRRQAAAFDPCLCFVFRSEGQAVGAFATHIDDIFGCGEPHVSAKMRNFSEQRFGEMKLQGESCVHVGMELVQDSAFSATLTQGNLTGNLQPLNTSPPLSAALQKPPSPEDVKLRLCKLSELCALATVSRPDICARLARIASRINALLGRDVYRINDLVATAKEAQKAASLKYVSASQLGWGNPAPRNANIRRRWEKLHGNFMTIAVGSDAAYGGQSRSGKCRLGYVIGLMSPNLRVPCHIIQWT